MFTSTPLRTLVAGGALSVALLGLGPALAAAQAGDGTCVPIGSAEQVRAGAANAQNADGNGAGVLGEGYGYGYGQDDHDVVAEYGPRAGGHGTQAGDLDRDRLMDGDQTGTADRLVDRQGIRDRLGDGSCMLVE